MSTKYIGWVGAILVGVAAIASCGAMSMETTPLDEPPVAPPAVAPRLVRPDAGIEARQTTESERH